MGGILEFSRGIGKTSFLKKNTFLKGHPTMARHYGALPLSGGAVEARGRAGVLAVVSLVLCVLAFSGFWHVHEPAELLMLRERDGRQARPQMLDMTWNMADLPDEPFGPEGPLGSFPVEDLDKENPMPLGAYPVDEVCACNHACGRAARTQQRRHTGTETNWTDPRA